MQRVHEEGGCNPLALRYLNGGSVAETKKEEKADNKDNPFAVLKGLNLDKN